MWYDIVCLVIIGLSIWRGMVKGLVWQLATIAGLLICFFFANTVSSSVAPQLGIDPPLSRWVAIFGLYVVSSFGAFALARLIKGSLEKMKFDDFDRHLGAIFGSVKGATICLTASFFMFTLSGSTRNTVMHSKAGYASAVAFSKIQPVLPAEFDEIISPYLAGFDPEAIEKHKKEHPEDGYNQNKKSTGIKDVLVKKTGGNSEDPQIKEMINKIPGLFGQELQQIVYETFKKTDPKDRPQLLEKLSSGLPGLIRQVASEWNEGKPAPDPVPQTWNESMRQRRAKLLREIAGVYTEHLEAQQNIMEEVVYALQGVPDPVTLKVLDDWHADLLSRKPDPDPSTDIKTSLDRRVLLQIQKAGISIGTLPGEIQTRLNDVIKG